MKQHATFTLLIALGVWVLFVCIRIEILDARANHWLSRPEAHDPAGGKWRVSMAGNEPRDELRRGLVGWAYFSTSLRLVPFCLRSPRQSQALAFGGVWLRA
ncbi:MAG: hypothetical protein JWQ71_3712 [Pedosphaera sp.]|nr:hypothetical protein [Pedosphaera sp.]